MKVTIYTAAFGGYDDLPEHPEIPGVGFVAFTDGAEGDGWERISVPPDGTHPRMQAKFYKLRPDLCLPETDYSIWIDASHVITDVHFVDHCMASLHNSDLALYSHPWRDCIYEEAEASTWLEKYNGEPILEQVSSYREEGHPEHWGLWACGTLARRHTPEVFEVMALWQAEIARWSYQDQLSLPVVLRRTGYKASAFPIHQVFGNPWHQIKAHHRSD